MSMHKKAIFSVLSVLSGLCLLAYPWIREYLYENQVDSIVSAYEVRTDELEDRDKEQALDLARAYNEQLAHSKITLKDPFSADMKVSDGEGRLFDYDSLLLCDDSGLMGSIKIPKIAVYLPIYHGTSAEVLERGVGHLENTSFPIGGIPSHAVLSAHTGLNTAKLFTDLVNLEEGDQFYLYIMGETLAYEVCDIHVVLPEETERLTIQPGRDLVTLITCTPYGVNSHRLLVTGERTVYTEDAYKQQAEKNQEEDLDSLWMRAYKEAVLIGISIVLFSILIVLNIKNIGSS